MLLAVLGFQFRTENCFGYQKGDYCSCI